ncbi:putative Sorting nexin-8 [Hypsibius exemplaris]|uniref:Sorting nexin-8 n=1 Tax=Hypsibius exemplaris TaxID=2072580 RepID=A0A1W0X3D8_HYPEX|nr:putative Sorting nexin-8 [Hypsibius exemplaris]
MGLPQESLLISNGTLDGPVIRVEQIPGKKGAFLKHVEYEVISQKAQSSRRYNDFVVLHDALLQIFPTRLIPRLPPKKAMGVDEEFLGKRQKALERYMTILGRHPVIGRSGLFQHFLTHSGKDLQTSTKEKFKVEEFFSVNSPEYEHVRPGDWTSHLNEVKDRMINAEMSLQKIREIFEAIYLCSRDQVKNYMALNAELSNLCTTTTSPFVEIVNGIAVARQPYTGILGDVASEIASVTKQWLELANTEDEMFADYLLMMKDLMKGWKDFFARQSKYAADEQRVLEKALNAKKKDGADDIAKTTANAENRIKFSLLCLQQELSFIEGLLGPLVARFLQTLAGNEKRHFGKISNAWQDVEDVSSLLSMSNAMGGVAGLRSEPTAPASPREPHTPLQSPGINGKNPFLEN